jgi:hypothetical protein
MGRARLKRDGGAERAETPGGSMGKGQKRSKTLREVAKDGVLCRHFSILDGRASLLDLLTSKVFMKS